MPEITTPVVPVLVNYTCDGCHNGQMTATGSLDGIRRVEMPDGSTRNFALHRCNACGGEQFLDRVYPHIRHEHATTPVAEAA